MEFVQSLGAFILGTILSFYTLVAAVLLVIDNYEKFIRPYLPRKMDNLLMRFRNQMSLKPIPFLILVLVILAATQEYHGVRLSNISLQKRLEPKLSIELVSWGVLPVIEKDALQVFKKLGCFPHHSHLLKVSNIGGEIISNVKVQFTASSSMKTPSFNLRRLNISKSKDDQPFNLNPNEFTYINFISRCEVINRSGDKPKYDFKEHPYFITFASRVFGNWKFDIGEQEVEIMAHGNIGKAIVKRYSIVVKKTGNLSVSEIPIQ